MSNLFLRLTALPSGLCPYPPEEGRLAVSVGMTPRPQLGPSMLRGLRPEAEPSPDFVGAPLTRRGAVPIR